MAINQSWLVVFDYKTVRIYDSHDRLAASYPATSGRYDQDGQPISSISDQDREDLGPIPHGEYVLQPKEFSDAGVGRRLMQWLRDREFKSPITASIWGIGLKRGEMMGADFGNTRITMHPLGPNPRSGFFLHGGHFAGSKGCIDVGNFDLDMKALLQSQSGAVHVIVDYTPNQALVRQILDARASYRTESSETSPPPALRAFANATNFFQRAQPSTPSPPAAPAPPRQSPVQPSPPQHDWLKQMHDQQIERRKDEATRQIEEARRRQDVEAQQRREREALDRQRRELEERRRQEARRTEDERRRREDEARYKATEDRERQRYQQEVIRRQADAARVREIQVEAAERQRRNQEMQRDQAARDTAQRDRDRVQTALNNEQKARDAAQVKAQKQATILNSKRLLDEQLRKQQKIKINLH